MKNKKKKRMMYGSIAAVAFLVLLFYFLQTYWAHRKFHDTKGATECVPLLGMFTMEDQLKEGKHELTQLQPGDILITLSTHSMGWRHGHAGLVIDEYTVLESVTLGTCSELCSTKHWEKYSNCVVLRIKGITPEEQKAVAQYAMENLVDIRYRLLAGVIGDKAPGADGKNFGVQCGYLVWYAWYQMGYDLDSDGGKLVTVHDLLHSDQLEVIQIFGMDDNRNPIQ